MSNDNNGVPPRLAEIVSNFQLCQGREKLEYLLEFAESLPQLPAWLEGRRDEMQPVVECMSPVSVYADTANGQINFYFDVPVESPTVRGFAAILQQGTVGLKAEDVLAIPTEFYLDMGLQHVLSGQRLNGMTAILAHMKRLAAESLAVSSPSGGGRSQP